MVATGLLHRIKTLFSPNAFNSPPPTDFSSDKSNPLDEDEQHQRLLDRLLDIDSLPSEHRQILAVERDILELATQETHHWDRALSRIQESKHNQNKTPRQELKETEDIAQAIRDAYDTDYKHYARGHHLSTELLHHVNEADGLGEETVQLTRQQILLFEVLQEFAMTNSWVASIHYNGLRLMFLNPEDELGNAILDHEMKRRTSELILSTTTVIETVGQTLLEVQRDHDCTDQPLANIIDMLASDDLITEEEQETMHSIRKMRNRVAHDMVERTTLDWVDDFQELVLDCFTTVEAIEYPVRERLEADLPPEVAEEYLEVLLPALEEETDWNAAVKTGE